MTGIYIPSGPDKEIDDSQFTYSPKQSIPSESDARSSNFNSCESNCSKVTHESMPVPLSKKPKVVKVKHNNATRKVNTVNPIVNNARPKADFHKSVSPFRKSFNRTTTLRTNFLNQKVNTAEVNAVSAVKGKRETAVKPSAALQNKGIVDSVCSRHMTRNKAYLAEYQDFNGGPVAFGGKRFKEANHSIGIEDNIDVGDSEIEAEFAQDYFVLPIWSSYTSTIKNSKAKNADLPYRKKAIGTKWVYRNKKDERGVVVRNKARFVAQGHRQEEGIDYDEVFSPVARIEAIRIFLAFASFMGFIVYQMDVKSTFLYGKIDDEVYVSQPPGFIDPKYPKKVYKVVKALYGLHQAPRS
ncbi:putative ribonuclease H-like domain-containing protein [Tanacetum coccineum]